MTPQETIDACSEAGIRLRIAPDGKFTATPLSKVTQMLREEIGLNRSAIIELIEARDGTGEELVIEPAPVPDPPKPSIGRVIIDRALNEFGIRLVLDTPNRWGRIRCITPFERVGEVPEGAKALLPESMHIVRNRTQVPAVLGALIVSFTPEILAELRAPFMPEPPPLPADATPKQRSLWERMAQPDNLTPGAADNQRRVRDLLFGTTGEDARATRRSQQLETVLPFVFAAKQR